MAKAVLITGAGGFLAGHFAEAFSSAGWRTIGAGRRDTDGSAARFDRHAVHDVCDVAGNAALLEAHAPDAIVHLAAPANVQQSVRTPLADMHGHVLPAAAVLESVRVTGSGAHFILISSAAVYGDPATLPVREDAPLAPISPYGFHKLQQEILLQEYVEIHGVRGSIARIFSTYGERMRRLAVWDITRRALAGHYSVYGTGEESRDYLYAGDAAQAIVCIAENAPGSAEAVNVASGEAVSIRKLAEEILRFAGIDATPEFTGELLPGSPRAWRADTSLLRAFGWSVPEWSSGLARTINWIRAQH